MNITKLKDPKPFIQALKNHSVKAEVKLVDSAVECIRLTVDETIFEIYMENYGKKGIYIPLVRKIQKYRIEYEVAGEICSRDFDTRAEREAFSDKLELQNIQSSHTDPEVEEEDEPIPF